MSGCAHKVLHSVSPTVARGMYQSVSGISCSHLHPFTYQSTQPIALPDRAPHVPSLSPGVIEYELAAPAPCIAVVSHTTAWSWQLQSLACAMIQIQCTETHSHLLAARSPGINAIHLGGLHGTEAFPQGTICLNQ